MTFTATFTQGKSTYMTKIVAEDWQQADQIAARQHLTIVGVLVEEIDVLDSELKISRTDLQLKK